VLILVSKKIACDTSRQGNNEEQAHTRNKGTNEHDSKETAIFLETSESESEIAMCDRMQMYNIMYFFQV
jgi:hypothetical protein